MARPRRPRLFPPAPRRLEYRQPAPDVHASGVWSDGDLDRLRTDVGAGGLGLAVTESLPVHEDIEYGFHDRALGATYLLGLRESARRCLSTFPPSPLS